MKHSNYMFSAFVALLMMLLLTGQSISAPDSKGTDFWLMFNSNLGTPTLTVFITSDVNTSGTVTPQGGAPIPLL